MPQHERSYLGIDVDWRMDLSINHKLSSLCCCDKPKERSLDTFLRALVGGGYIIISWKPFAVHNLVRPQRGKGGEIITG